MASMSGLRDVAPAKLNLSLKVLGRRRDSYHEISSLVAFAELGDAVCFEPGGDLRIEADGPFAGEIDGENLMLRTAQAAKEIAPALSLGLFRLTKNLPVAAGLGGGSADAAAVLRLLHRADPKAIHRAQLQSLASCLGSDITACLESCSVLMTGRGEVVTPVPCLPLCGAVLVNPRLPLSAAKVYAELAAPIAEQRQDPFEGPATPRFDCDFERLLSFLEQNGNDLQPAATRLAPVIEEVLQALRSLEGARTPRLSGSGPTCFALFADAHAAAHAARQLASACPEWWVAATTVGDGKGSAGRPQ